MFFSLKDNSVENKQNAETSKEDPSITVENLQEYSSFSHVELPLKELHKYSFDAFKYWVSVNEWRRAKEFELDFD